MTRYVISFKMVYYTFLSGKEFLKFGNVACTLVYLTVSGLICTTGPRLISLAPGIGPAVNVADWIGLKFPKMWY